MSPDEIAADIQERVIAFLDARGGYVASASERELIALLRAYVSLDSRLQPFIDLMLQFGDARAAAERAYATDWQPSPTRPADWDTAYPVALTGKTLEAMQYLARFVLDQVRAPWPLPFDAIGAADHLFCLAAAIRAAPGEAE